MISILFTALLYSVCMADQYLHYPRGCNNRLNEKSANRNNGNRLFDSQNNNRGGYNVGEFGDTEGFAGNPTFSDSIINNQNQFDAVTNMKFNYDNEAWKTDAGRLQNEDVYVGGSIMQMTWTSQHGCGNDKNNCNMIIGYTCDSHPVTENVLQTNYDASASDPGYARQTTAQKGTNDAKTDYTYVTGLRVQLANGQNTNTPDDPNSATSIQQTFANNNNNERGRHESEEYYRWGKERERNKGLFTADQKLQGNDQTKTRQNPGGTRRGLEIPEERDYYPWWKPTIWRTLAIGHNDLAECQAQMAAKSQQAETKWHCVPLKSDVNSGQTQKVQDILKAKTSGECTAAGGDWQGEKWNMALPECFKNPWTQTNNLGNTDGSPHGGLPITYNLTLPTVDEMAATGCYKYQHTDSTGATIDYVRFVIRTRYNISTMDYDPYKTFSECNQNNNNKVQSPINQNPTVDVGVEAQGLRLAINTAQTGRTFQDRTHVMTMISRPAALNNKVLHNLNVQGKRGNIVQTFPAVEYDYWPKFLETKRGDCAVMSWTGSNTHNNGNPAGDGQAGDAGEGRGGSDRHNMMQYLDKTKSFPVPLDRFDDIGATELLANSDCFYTHNGQPLTSGPQNQWQNKDAQAYLLSGGFYRTMASVGQENNNNNELDVLLNNAPATMRSITCCPQITGTFIMGNTRNNNFSNRDQKLTWTITN